MILDDAVAENTGTKFKADYIVKKKSREPQVQAQQAK